jgi:hypothetical protein
VRACEEDINKFSIKKRIKNSEKEIPHLRTVHLSKYQMEPEKVMQYNFLKKN